ncbi:MAG: hypothetical protein HY078_09505 [Elusimicrobia bacterium]|nr:hypothetical protein [Elusimicrobiota bacterium]
MTLLRVFFFLLACAGAGYATVGAFLVPLAINGDAKSALANAAFGWVCLYCSYRGLGWLRAAPPAPQTPSAPVPAGPKPASEMDWAPVALSLIFSGAGQVRNGQILKGLLLAPASGLFCSPAPYPGSMFFGLAVFWIFAVVDAYVVSRRLFLAAKPSGKDG